MTLKTKRIEGGVSVYPDIPTIIQHDHVFYCDDELRFVVLSDFKSDIGTERCGHQYWHVWYGPTCRSCRGAPKSVGEMCLAKYSHEWRCNRCYARNPQDSTSHGWRYIPTEEDE